MRLRPNYYLLCDLKAKNMWINLIKAFLFLLFGVGRRQRRHSATSVDVRLLLFFF